MIWISAYSCFVFYLLFHLILCICGSLHLYISLLYIMFYICSLIIPIVCLLYILIHFTIWCIPYCFNCMVIFSLCVFLFFFFFFFFLFCVVSLYFSSVWISIRSLSFCIARILLLFLHLVLHDVHSSLLFGESYLQYIYYILIL